MNIRWKRGMKEGVDQEKRTKEKHNRQEKKRGQRSKRQRAKKNRGPCPSFITRHSLPAVRMAASVCIASLSDEANSVPVRMMIMTMKALIFWKSNKINQQTFGEFGPLSRLKQRPRLVFNGVEDVSTELTILGTLHSAARSSSSRSLMNVFIDKIAVTCLMITSYVPLSESGRPYQEGMSTPDGYFHRSPAARSVLLNRQVLSASQFSDFPNVVSHRVN